MSEDEKDYYSFDEVLSDLRMEEDELKRLVSAGEIRAFRDRDTMRFKAVDVERLKQDDESDVGEELDLDDIDLDDDLDLDLDLDLSGDEEIVLEDIDLEDDEELDLSPGVEEIDLGGAQDEAADAPRRRAPRGQATPDEEEAKDGALLVPLLLGFIVLVLGNFAVWGAAGGTVNSLTRFLADLFA